MAKEPPAGYGTGLTEKGGLANTLEQTIPRVPSTQADINDLIGPYIKELMNLGPEYGAEMQFLHPYLTGTPTTFQGLEAAGAADQSPTGSKSLQAAGANLAKAIEGEPTPGFGTGPNNLVQSAQQFTGSLPYTQILQDVLQAGKQEILGYSTIPNLRNINTSQWPSAIAAVVPQLEKSIGYNPSTGMPTAATAAIQAGANPGGYTGGSGGTNQPPTPAPSNLYKPNVSPGAG